MYANQELNQLSQPASATNLSKRWYVCFPTSSVDLPRGSNARSTKAAGSFRLMRARRR